jgi:hypothetical protein
LKNTKKNQIVEKYKLIGKIISDGASGFKLIVRFEKGGGGHGVNPHYLSVL